MANQIGLLLILLFVSNGRLAFSQDTTNDYQSESTRQLPIETLLQLAQLLPLAINLTQTILPPGMLGLQKESLPTDLQPSQQDRRLFVFRQGGAQSGSGAPIPYYQIDEEERNVDPRLFVFRRDSDHMPGNPSTFDHRIEETGRPSILDNSDAEISGSFDYSVESKPTNPSVNRRQQSLPHRALKYGRNDPKNSRLNIPAPEIDQRLFVFRRNEERPSFEVNSPVGNRYGTDPVSRQIVTDVLSGGSDSSRRLGDNGSSSESLLKAMLLNMLQNSDS